MINRAIEKSLIDKSIESKVYNPNILTNDNKKSIKTKIMTNLREADRVDIAVSYCVWSGLVLIYKDLERYDASSRMIITTEGFVTDPRSLEKLLELKISVKVYDPSKGDKGFHLKSYMFEKGKNRSIIIGSSNISNRAFGLVHEMAVEINASEKGYIVDEYSKIFEDIWDDEKSIVLDRQFVEGYKSLYKDKRKAEKYLFEKLLDADVIKPNYMQVKALEELNICRDTEDRGLVIAATGTGKTYLSAFDVQQVNANKVLFLVHNRLILTDAVKTFRKVFPDKLIEEVSSSNKHMIKEADFVFTTDKTAYNHIIKNDDIDSNTFDYVIYDEAHKIGDETLYNHIINELNPKFTLGITATPERTKNPSFLFETFKYSVPYEIRLLDAMKHELICPFTYYGLALTDELLDVGEKFNYTELSSYLKDLINEKGHYGENLKGIVFCSDKNEVKKLTEELNKIGINTKAVISGQNEAKRELVEEYIEDLKSDEDGTTELICVVNKFNEGVDIPDINTIIMLRSTTSAIIYLQQLGRGLRKTDDPHKYVTVLDIIGNSKNDYSIAEVLTGGETADKRELFRHAEGSFTEVSPFINVEIEEEAMENIIKSISNSFKVKTRLKQKYYDELSRYEYIPKLVDLYNNKYFKELDLLQLLFKNFYDPFSDYYEKKYEIEANDIFLQKFFSLITQFVFRSYSNNELKDYVKILNGEYIENEILRRVLLKNEFSDGIGSAVYAEYNKAKYELPSVFEHVDGSLTICDEIIDLLKTKNAYELFQEHIDLFDFLSTQEETTMQLFDLVDKADFLYKMDSDDCYLNAVGERINHEKKRVYCPIKIAEDPINYDNYLLDENTIVYNTQTSKTEKSAINKIKNFEKGGYKFYICAKFPHLGYSSTSYFNMGELDFDIGNASEVKVRKNEKGNEVYYHQICFKLHQTVPKELLEFKRDL